MVRPGSSLPLRLHRPGERFIPFALAATLLLTADPAWAAFASVGSFCSTGNKIAGATVNHTTTANLDAGNLGVIAYASDNLATTDGNTNTHLTLTDIAGNTWTKAREFTNAQTGPGTGVTVSIWYSKVATTLTTGTNRMTMTFSGSITAKAMACWEFTMGAGNVVKVDGGADLANDAVDTGSITRGGLANVSHLWVRASGGEYSAGGSTYTVSTNFTTFTHTTSHTGAGAADSNITARGEFRIFTGTSQATNPTVGGAVDHAATMVAFSESVCSVAEPSYVAVNAQAGQATIYWASANPVIVLRKTNSAFVAADAPKHGMNYAANAAVGAATVIYNGTAATAGDTCSATSCVDTGLASADTYYYKVFAKSGVSETSCYSTGTVNPANGVSALPKLVNASWPVPWSFAMAGGAMMKPGIVGADGSVSTGSNANWIFSLDATAGAPRWTPVSTGQAVQSWLTWLPVGSGWSSATWPKRKLIRIDPTKVGTGGVTDFPVLVHLASDTQLQAFAQANGNDILFTAADGTTKLSHEIERYDSATGELIAWVKVPSVSSTADTDIYMYYGNATAGSQQNPTDVWSNGYVGVWHLKETPTGGSGEVKDSTEYAGHGTTWNMTAADRVAGKVGYAYKFTAGTSGSGSLVYTGDRPEMQLPIYSWSAWIRGDSQPVCDALGTNGQPIWNADSQFNFGWQHTGCSFNQAAAHSDGDVESAAGWKSTQIPGAALAATTWQHIAATYDGTTLRVYGDGALQASTPHGPPIAAAGSFSIGNGGDNVTRFTNFAGQIDEVRVGSTVRSDAWMLTEYNNQSSPATFATVVGGEEAGTWTPSTPCTACSYVVGGDQSGKVYSVDELTGNTKWSVDFSAAGLNRANNIQAAVAAQLRADSDAAFQSAYTADVVFAASRNTGATNCGAATNNNKVFAINMADGTVLWTFNNTCAAAPAGGAMDYVTGMPYVDYARNRLYVTSGDAGATQRSLWIIKTVDGEGVLKGQVMTCAACSGLGALDSSPTLGSDGNTLYFGNITGRLYAFDVNTLAIRWYRDLGAAIKGFVWDGGAGNLYLSTTNTVWRIKDNFNDTGAVDSSDNVRSTVQWQRTVNGASMPLLLSNAVYVGSSSDFLLHEIALDNSAEKTLALDSTAVGDVSTDDGTNVYVSTTAGRLYKIQVPLP
jgi:hypothetical protein